MRKQAVVSGLLVPLLVVVGCSGSGATPTLTATALPASRTISGQISYAGAALANHKIVVVAVRPGEQGAPAYSTVIAKLGPYTLSNVADSTYNVFAFIDVGDDMGAPKPDEPLGWYDPGGDGTPDAVVIQNGSAAATVDIAIRDR